MKISFQAAAAIALLAGCPLPVHADTFGSGANQFDIDFATIGNAGNVADDTGYGAVGYDYRISKHEVSRAMIESYNTLSGGPMITMADMTSYGGNGVNRPASGVSWNKAARFVNWLNTSQGHSAAYKFTTSGGNDNIVLWDALDAGYDAANPFRNANAHYYLPSEDEWYKAAYYDPAANGGTGGYWDYATGSDTAPTAVAGGTTSGTAVYNGQSGPADITNAGGLSPYGTMAQGGNVWEWSESALSAPNDSADEARVIRGSAWSVSSWLEATSRNSGSPSIENIGNYGFRVASVAELPRPEIALQQPAGNPLSSGTSLVDFGAAPLGSPLMLTFTIRNNGTADLTGISLSRDGPDAADFATTGPGVTQLAPGELTTFSVTFAPADSGEKTAAVHIASNDADENPFVIHLTGRALSTADDTDGDGMNDVAEWKLAPLGFDWEVADPARVDLYFEHAGANGLHTEAEIQAMHAPAPVLSPDPATGLFTLTMDWRKSPDLDAFTDLPASPGQVSVNADGDIEFTIESTEERAFFHFRTQ